MAQEVRDRAALEYADALARDIAAAGEAMQLPYVAVSADISNPEPMIGCDGRPLAETVFRWLDADFRYWEHHAFALRSAFVYAARSCAEPFCFSNGTFHGWRPSSALDAINRQGRIDTFGVGTAIVAPAYLPGGVIGEVVWASPELRRDVRGVFQARADDLHGLALRFIAAYHDAWHPVVARPAARLTRREIQCLKLAAAGRTDSEIAETVKISVASVRFHITNAWRKLQVVGRSQAIHRAAALGYIGVTPDQVVAAD
jgi:DNA-binding CsgD family transcriptional regulator